jgi:hypothetical protein
LDELAGGQFAGAFLSHPGIAPMTVRSFLWSLAVAVDLAFVPRRAPTRHQGGDLE